MKLAKVILHLVISGAIVSALVYFLLKDGGAAELGKVFRGVRYEWIGGYLLLSILGLVCRAIRYRIMLLHSADGKTTIRTSRMLLVTAVRNATVDLLPARLGELAYLYLMRFYRVPLASALSSFGFAIVLDMLVLFFLLLLLALFALLSPSAVHGASGGGMALVAMLSLFLGTVVVKFLPQLISLVGKMFERLLDLFAKRVRWAAENANKFRETFDEISSDILRFEAAGVVRKLLVLTFVLRLAKYGALYVLLLGVLEALSVSSTSIHFACSTIAFVSAESAASLPVSGVMGFGAYEAAWSGVFSLCGASVENPVRVGFAVHLISQVVGYSLGILAVMYFVMVDLRRTYGREFASKDQTSLY